MKPIQIHPVTALAGAAALGALLGLTSLVQVASKKTAGQGERRNISALTPEQRAILDHMSIVDLDDGLGGTVKTLRISDINVQIVNGLDATNGYPTDPNSIDPLLTSTNGLGNLIVGYNEPGNLFGDDRTGSHNIVFGLANSFSSFGGLVGPHNSTISGAFASVSGGFGNTASGLLSSVSGGDNNTASGYWSSVTGGDRNTASGRMSSVSGGQGNTASGDDSSVSGGIYNTASGDYSSVSGGYSNTASGFISFVSGGGINTASGDNSSVSGGIVNSASGDYSSISGGYVNVASGAYSSVSGGFYRSVSGTNDWRAGSLFEDF